MLIRARELPSLLSLAKSSYSAALRQTMVGIGNQSYTDASCLPSREIRLSNESQQR